MSSENPFSFSAAVADAVEHCWLKAAAPAEWNLNRVQFQLLLERSAAHRFDGKLPDSETVQGYLETLHVADLALAGACSAGSAAAWDFFVAQYRPELYRAARAIAGEASGRELADSLYADLYGLREREGRRNSLLDYFHGRSKLGTWLRAVLAQRHVDEIRHARRSESLDDPADAEGPEGASVPTYARAANDAPEPERARFVAIFQVALSAVLAGLDARDRLRLAYYYVERLKLAQIGKLLGEHEATVSRKLERTRREVRECVESALLGERKLSEAQLQLCYEYAREQWPFDLTQVLSLRE